VAIFLNSISKRNAAMKLTLKNIDLSVTCPSDDAYIAQYESRCDSLRVKGDKLALAHKAARQQAHKAGGHAARMAAFTRQRADRHT
jgi:hypothetical protein